MSPRKATPLPESHPHLAAEWHPELNGDLRPEDVSSSFKTPVWWTCPRDPEHAYRMRIDVRVHGGKCKECPLRLPTSGESLKERRPDLAREWDYERNGSLTPDIVTLSSGRKAWWICSKCGHRYESVIAPRTVKGVGCPACSGRVATETTSLQVTHPELAAEWHPTKNDVLTPASVRPGSSRSVWWRCTSCDHEWTAAISSRTKRGTGCPACSGRVATTATSLATLNPELAAQWHPTLNDRKPDQVKSGSEYEATWLCANNPEHVWQARVAHRAVMGIWDCPLCSGGKWTVQRLRLFVASLTTTSAR